MSRDLNTELSLASGGHSPGRGAGAGGSRGQSRRPPEAGGHCGAWASVRGPGQLRRGRQSGAEAGAVAPGDILRSSGGGHQGTNESCPDCDNCLHAHIRRTTLRLNISQLCWLSRWRKWRTRRCWCPGSSLTPGRTRSTGWKPSATMQRRCKWFLFLRLQVHVKLPICFSHLTFD